MRTARTGTTALLKISWFAVALLVAGCGGTDSSKTTIEPTTTPPATPTTTVAQATPTLTATPKPTHVPTTKPAPRTTVRTTRPPQPRPSTTSAAPVRNCDPAYPDVCLHDGIGDYDCAGGSGNGPNYVSGPIRVLPPDPFGLDANGNGVGCE